MPLFYWRIYLNWWWGRKWCPRTDHVDTPCMHTSSYWESFHPSILPSFHSSILPSFHPSILACTFEFAMKKPQLFTSAHQSRMCARHVQWTATDPSASQSLLQGTLWSRTGNIIAIIIIFTFHTIVSVNISVIDLSAIFHSVFVWH